MSLNELKVIKYIVFAVLVFYMVVAVYKENRLNKTEKIIGIILP